MELRYYWQLLRRRLPWVIILTALGTSIGLGLALTLPPVFRSQAVLVVESEQIPDELAASTVQTSETEALQIIRQRILSREVLLELANRLNIYANSSEISGDRKVADLRSRIEINTVGGRAVRGARDATIVTVSFSAPNARLAAETANEVVTLILQENVQMRTSVARQTLDFFSQEVERLEQSLSRVSGQILNFQESNIQALPDSLDFRRSRQAALQERLLLLQREQTALQDRRAQLIALFESTGRTDLTTRQSTSSGTPHSNQRPEERQLEELRTEYARLSAVLSDSNPRMVLLNSQIEAATRAVANLPPQADSSSEIETGSVQKSLFDIQLADLDAQISYITDQKQTVEEEMTGIARTIADTPSNAATLSALERDYQNLQEQYNQAVANKALAETGSMIESLSRGQRISVVEHAVPAERPSSPNRPMISIIGFLGGAVLGLGTFVILELLNSTVRRSQDLRSTIQIETFATIPYMTTRREHLRRRVSTLSFSIAIVVGVSGTMWFIDQNVRPLEPVLERILNTLTLSQIP